MFKRFFLPTLYHILQEREIFLRFSFHEKTEKEKEKEEEEKEEEEEEVMLIDSLHEASMLRSSALGEKLIPKTKHKYKKEKEEVFSPCLSYRVLHHTRSVSHSLSDSEEDGRKKRSCREQYHGYAFSEDENVDSDVELASILSPRTGHNSNTKNKLTSRSAGFMSPQMATMLSTNKETTLSSNSFPNTPPNLTTFGASANSNTTRTTTKHPSFVKSTTKKNVKSMKNA
jgi:hypothetical protein